MKTLFSAVVLSSGLAWAAEPAVSLGSAVELFEGGSVSALSRSTMDLLEELAVSEAAAVEYPTLMIDVPDGPSVVAPLSRLYVPGDGRWSGYGLIEGGHFTLTVSGDSVHVSVVVGTVVREFHGAITGDEISVTEVDQPQSMSFRCGWDVDAGISLFGSSAIESQTGTPTATIEVMFITLNSLEIGVALSGIGNPLDPVETRTNLLIDGLVNGMNAALASSGLPGIQMSSKVVYRSYLDENAIFANPLGAFRDDQDGVADYTEDLQRDSNSDLTVVLRSWAENNGTAITPGGTVIPSYTPASITLPASTLSSVAGVGARVFNHEVGHTFGLVHETMAGKESSPFGKGYAFDNGVLEFSTIMASAAGTNFIPYYSTPAISYMGEPIGVAGVNDSVSALAIEAPKREAVEPVLPPAVPDCNGDGVPDSIELAYWSFDRFATANGVPDECETTDPYLKSVYTAYFPTAIRPDINGNITHDSRDVELGTLSDCDLNGLADLYQTTWQVNRSATLNVNFAALSPSDVFGGVYVQLPDAVDDVEFTIETTHQDLNGSPRDVFIEMFVNEQSVGVVFDETVTSCGIYTFSTTVTASTFNSLLVNRQAMIRFEVTAPMAPTSCPGVRGDTTISFEYLSAEAAAADADRDGIIDTCPAEGCNVADWDNNGIIDLPDVDAFIVAYLGLDDRADLAPPYGIWDLDDLDTFNVAVAAGCP